MDLLASATRTPLVRSFVHRSGVAGALGCLIVFSVGCGDGSEDDTGTEAVSNYGAVDSTPCDLGSRSDEGSPRTILIACTETRDGRRLELRSTGGRGLSCLQIEGVDGIGPRGCGYAPLERVPPIEQAVLFDGSAQVSASGPLEIYGGLAADVESVELTYTRSSGEREGSQASVFWVEDPELLRDLSIDEPFGYFAAEIPADIGACRVQAFNGVGEGIGADQCDPYRGLAPDSFLLVGRNVDGS